MSNFKPNIQRDNIDEEAIKAVQMQFDINMLILKKGDVLREIDCLERKLTREEESLKTLLQKQKWLEHSIQFLDVKLRLKENINSLSEKKMEALSQQCDSYTHLNKEKERSLFLLQKQVELFRRELLFPRIAFVCGVSGLVLGIAGLICGFFR